MSFRARLTSFFLVIVVLPMLAIGGLVLKVIGDERQGEATARLQGAASEALQYYQSSVSSADADALALAREVAVLTPAQMVMRAEALQSAAGLARVGIRINGRSILDHGTKLAIAPGTARVDVTNGPHLKVTVSDLTATDYVRELSGPGVLILVQQKGHTLGSDLPGGAHIPIRGGSVKLAGQQYRAVRDQVIGYGKSPVVVTVLSSVAAATGSATGSLLEMGVFLLVLLLLAVGFALLTSRGLQDQLRNFLQAARRLGAGDFSRPIAIQGRDEFAALGAEFNQMSAQLEARLEDLAQERRRLRESLLRIGQLFASNLDRKALLDLALQTAVDAVDAGSGRLSSRSTPDEPLLETARVGSLDDYGTAVLEAEAGALHSGLLNEVNADGLHVASVALAARERGARVHGVITVARRGEPFSEDDRDLLKSLGAQATVALQNVDLHLQVSRQAVTDQLTGLANHGRFQDLLSTEVEQVRRYGHPLSLILLDIDNFKSVNDTYGHQQGDQVLKAVARALRENSREADVPARYGGEEMALILPHTDLEGAFAIAERARESIESLCVPLVEGVGDLRVTASLGVATMTEGEKDGLIGEADAALYEAKRSGKNRTLRAARVVRAG
jgi:diguanylate cyclase (GGDEF)-like protein